MSNDPVQNKWCKTKLIYDIRISKRSILQHFGGGCNDGCQVWDVANCPNRKALTGDGSNSTGFWRGPKGGFGVYFPKPHWGVLMVRAKAGAWSGCSSWSAAFYLEISAQSGPCEMSKCISTVQARTKCGSRSWDRPSSSTSSSFSNIIILHLIIFLLLDLIILNIINLHLIFRNITIIILFILLLNIIINIIIHYPPPPPHCLGSLAGIILKGEFQGSPLGPPMIAG